VEKNLLKPENETELSGTGQSTTESRTKKKREKKKTAINLLLNKFRENGCFCCHRIGQLDTHHIRPSLKSFRIKSKRGSILAVKQELSKCVPLCKTCHKRVHRMFTNEQLDFYGLSVLDDVRDYLRRKGAIK